MSVQNQMEWLPLIAGILVVLFVNVFVGIVANAVDYQVVGDVQWLVWIGSLLAGALTTAGLQ